jgi:chromatin segregation and condensation protein Rec8/ScpA/Scc1 (kleisin family)
VIVIIIILGVLLQESITFQELCKGANRRTAAACFMEVLQLKTWGLVETAQTAPFGAISVAPTSKLVLVQT